MQKIYRDDVYPKKEGRDCRIGEVKLGEVLGPEGSGPYSTVVRGTQKRYTGSPLATELVPLNWVTNPTVLN